MTRTRALSAIVALPVAWIAASLPAAAQDGPFTRVEYWECPSENLDALAATVDSVWAPIFGELTEEGHFESWRWERPVAARDFEFAGGQESSRDVTPPAQFVVVTTAESREAMDAAWEELVDRLQARFPDDLRPTRFCGDLMIVDYVQGRGS